MGILSWESVFLTWSFLNIRPWVYPPIDFSESVYLNLQYYQHHEPTSIPPSSPKQSKGLDYISSNYQLKGNEKRKKSGFFRETSNFYFLALKLGKWLLSNMRKWFPKGFVMKAIFRFPNLLRKKIILLILVTEKKRFWRSIWGYRHNKSKFFAGFFFLINFY